MIVGKVTGKAIPPGQGILFNLEVVSVDGSSVVGLRHDEPPLERLYIDDAASVGPESLR